MPNPALSKSISLASRKPGPELWWPWLLHVHLNVYHFNDITPSMPPVNSY